MNKRKATWLLRLVFTVYMIVAVVPPVAVVESLRLWSAGESYSFWRASVSPLQSVILFALNGIFVWFWSPYAQKIVNQHLFRGLRERAREALRATGRD